MLEIQNITAGYRKDRVLHDISCRPEQGQITALLGPNGCGKTTLLRVISGLMRPEKGRVLLNGKDIHAMKPAERARQIACLTQDRVIPAMTAGQFVLHGRFPYLRYPRVYSEEDRRIARQCMEATGTVSFNEKMMRELSGGQRQSVFLAMALAQQTEILLMDEPAAWMDTAHRFQLYSMLQTLRQQGKCVIIVMHDLPEALACADHVLLMKGGRLITEGAPAAILQSGKADEVFGVSLRRIDTTEGPHYYCIPQGGEP